ncbi:glutamine synthetase III family protein [Sediminitomix flava]|uniref:Glutamine synthetase n=1 Tax=Sediminitomix flava TaxID=379075 RepID=A0A315ZAP4_SEDFL|nr:glutamine synthetase III [Sediminitomix flava]PWJ42362.1 glutamine synthetase [Sediminitomix flava]
MTNLRLNAIEVSQQRSKEKLTSKKYSEFFGENSFGLSDMKQTLAPAIYEKVVAAIENGEKVSQETAEAVAAVLKQWALDKGATHCTHWFQPLTGSAAEKHDSFFDAHKGIEKFSGETLLQQEPDASSFPNGGIRSTNMARGYTVWDPSSPAFIVDETLCIPTVFVSYTGETLDYKAPLLKTVDAVSNAAADVAKYFDENVTKVSASLGCEQEYFVIDKAFYAARPDLYMTGRTLFGAKPPKGQQLDDHYFGSIAPRVFEFMKDFEARALALGIPVSTRHNEVAPGQFEVAPVYEEINVGVDHNLLMMDVMQKCADEHDLKVLLHEKPFAGLNGSGKHNNWSLITDTGRNLFKPENSLYFLTFLVNTLKAVHNRADVLRASIASVGNDHRLGANEAPPAIISVFLGSTLTAFLDEVEATGIISLDDSDSTYVDLGINKIPAMKLDNTDRNRTSPFAFTGNKFEFRAVGSTANCGTPMTVLNTIMAEQLQNFKTEVDALIAQGADKEAAIKDVLVRYITETKAIRFEGDGYSQEWVEEAERRGLSNVKDTPNALDFFVTPESIEMFSKMGIFSEKEIVARHDVWSEIYATKLTIETEVMNEIAINKVIPAAARYMKQLSDTAKGMKEVGVDASGIVTTITELSAAVTQVKDHATAMAAELENVLAIEDVSEQAKALCKNVKGLHHDAIREAVDKLELLVDDAEWPLPKYSEMLFLK